MATETYLLSVQGNLQQEYRENVIAFQSAGVATNDTLTYGTDLINAWVAHLEALWLAMFPAAYVVERYYARRATPKPSAGAHKQYQNGVKVGTRGSDATGQSLCPSLFLVPPMGTKSGGRIFLPCVGQGDIVNNNYLAGFVTAVGAWTTAAGTGAAGTGTLWQLAIYSRKNRTSSLAQITTLSPRLGYQRKRRSPV